MAKIVKGIAAFSLAATVILAISYKVTSSGILLPLAITSGTIAYHFVMRLMVGLAFHATMRNKADYRKRWYQVSKREMVVYEKLKVKQWKRRMPTYDPAAAYMGGDRTGYVSGGACPRDDRRAELSADFGRYLVRRVSGVYRDVRFVRRVRHGFRHHAAL